MCFVCCRELYIKKKTKQQEINPLLSILLTNKTKANLIN